MYVQCLKKVLTNILDIYFLHTIATCYGIEPAIEPVGVIIENFFSPDKLCCRPKLNWALFSEIPSQRHRRWKNTWRPEKENLSKVKKHMWLHLGSLDNLDGSGNVEDVEDAVAIVGVELHLRINFICSYFPVQKLVSKTDSYSKMMF